MNKQIYLFIAMILVLPAAFAVTPSNNSLYYNASLVLHFNKLPLDNSTNGILGAVTGTVVPTTTAGLVIAGNASGYFNEGDGGDYIKYEHERLNSILNWTACGWINFAGRASAANYWNVFTREDANYEKGTWMLQLQSTDDIGFESYYYLGAGGADRLSVSVNNNSWTEGWKHFCLMINITNRAGGVAASTNFYVYVNGSQVGTAATADTGAATTYAMTLGARAGGSITQTGYLDAFALYNRSLTEDEIDWLYENRVEVGPAAPPAAPPAGDTVNNTLPVINYSYPTGGWTLDNSSLWPININGTASVQNGTFTISINNTNWKNARTAAWFNFTYNGSGAAMEGRWDLSIVATSQYGNRSYANVTFYIDITNPAATSSLNNNFTLFYVERNITYQINYTDNLKIYSFNVTTPEGYKVSYNNINETKFIYNGSINVSAYNLGLHYLTTEFCDAHTKRDIKDWNYIEDKINKKLRFDFGSSYFSVRPSDKNKISDVSTTKEDDRYTFKFTRNNKDTYIPFIVESTEYIDIIGNDKGINGWLVIPKLNKWIDFNTRLKGLTYNIQRISDKSVMIEIDNIQSDIIEFQSAGDLNCDAKTWKYYLYNYTATYPASAIETTKEVFLLSINFKDIILKGNGTLIYGGLTYNTTNLTSSQHLNLTLNFTIPQSASNNSNVTFYWTYLMNDSSYQTINFTTFITRINLATCGALTSVYALNISIFNENLVSQYLPTSLAAVFTAWTNDSGNTLNFTFDFQGHTNYSICIFPNTTINTNAYFKYNTSSGFNQRWFLTNAKLTTNTSKLYLYNFITSTGVSELRGTLRTSSYDYNEDIITKLERYYPTENIWRTVQMDRSDTFGKVLFNIIEKSEDYRLVFEKNNVEIDRTTSMKFTCTSAICTADFIVSEASSGISAAPAFGYAYDNATKMFQLNFSDTTGLTTGARLRITEDKPDDIITICDTTVTAASGTINCNLTGQDGRFTVRIYSSASPEKAKIIMFLNLVSSQLNKIFSNKNESGFWAAGISIVLTSAGMVISPIAGIVMYIMSLSTIYFLGILNWVSVALISIVAVMGIMIAILLRRQY